MSKRVWLAEIDALRRADEVVDTQYFGTHGVRPFLADDADRPNVYYAPLLSGPPVLSSRLAVRGRVTGGGAQSRGELVIELDDAASALAESHLFDGRTLRVYVGAGAAFSGFQQIMAATISAARFDLSATGGALKKRLVLALDDGSGLFQAPVCPARFAGTATGLGGIEGSSDLAGKPKPRLLGQVFHVVPAPANPAMGIYALNFDEVGAPLAVDAIDGVYQGGLAYTIIGDVGSQSALEAAAPAIGEVVTCLALGLFKVGSVPAAPLTVSARASFSASRTAAGLVEELITGPGGLGAGGFDAAAFTALVAAQSAPLGLYVDGGRPLSAALDALLGTVGASWWMGADGVFRAARLATPALPGVLALDQSNILRADSIAARGPEALPIYRVSVGYEAHGRVLDDGDVLGAVDGETRAALAEAHRFALAEDAGVLALHPRSQALAVPGLFADEADAEAEAARLLALYSAERYPLRLVVREAGATAGLELGQTVSVDLGVGPFSTPRPMVVTGLTRGAPAAGDMTIEVWG